MLIRIAISKDADSNSDSKDIREEEGVPSMQEFQSGPNAYPQRKFSKNISR